MGIALPCGYILSVSEAEKAHLHRSPRTARLPSSHLLACSSSAVLMSATDGDVHDPHPSPSPYSLSLSLYFHPCSQ